MGAVRYMQWWCNRCLWSKSSNMSTRYQKSPHFSEDWTDLYRIDMNIEKLRLFVSAETFLLYSGWPWKKIINKTEIFVIHMLRNLSEQQIEIFKSIYHVRFCRFNQTVEDCTSLCTVGRYCMRRPLASKIAAPWVWGVWQAISQTFWFGSSFR